MIFYSSRYWVVAINTMEKEPSEAPERIIDPDAPEWLRFSAPDMRQGVERADEVNAARRRERDKWAQTTADNQAAKEYKEAQTPEMKEHDSAVCTDRADTVLAGSRGASRPSTAESEAKAG